MGKPDKSISPACDGQYFVTQREGWEKLRVSIANDRDDLRCRHEHASGKHDGLRVLLHAAQHDLQGRRAGEADTSDG